MILSISIDPTPTVNVTVPSQTVLTLFAATGPTGPQGVQGNVGPTGPAGNTDSINMNIAQTAHGFTVGNVLRIQNSATTYIKAQADNAVNAEVVGVVSVVIDANNFKLVMFGYVSGLTGLTKGTVYFLSHATAGLLTPTEPVQNGVRVSKPLLVANSTTSGFFTNNRGFIRNA